MGPLGGGSDEREAKGDRRRWAIGKGGRGCSGRRCPWECRFPRNRMAGRATACSQPTVIHHPTTSPAQNVDIIESTKSASAFTSPFRNSLSPQFIRAAHTATRQPRQRCLFCHAIHDVSPSVNNGPAVGPATPHPQSAEIRDPHTPSTHAPLPPRHHAASAMLFHVSGGPNLLGDFTTTHSL